MPACHKHDMHIHSEQCTHCKWNKNINISDTMRVLYRFWIPNNHSKQDIHWCLVSWFAPPYCTFDESSNTGYLQPETKLSCDHQRRTILSIHIIAACVLCLCMKYKKINLLALSIEAMISKMVCSNMCVMMC